MAALAVTMAAPAAVPTVSSVVVSPASVILAQGATQQFTAVVLGTNSPSQTVTWSKLGAGSIDAAGLFTRPAQTFTLQVITIIATAVQDGSTQGFATVTIAALALPGTIALTAGSPSVTQAVSTGGALVPILNFINKPAPRARTIVMPTEGRSIGI